MNFDIAKVLQVDKSVICRDITALNQQSKENIKKYGIVLGKIYTVEEIEKAKQSPSFEREYNLKYLGMIGNVFHTKDIEAALERGSNYDPDMINLFSQKSMGIDPGFGKRSCTGTLL